MLFSYTMAHPHKHTFRSCTQHASHRLYIEDLKLDHGGSVGIDTLGEVATGQHAVLRRRGDLFPESQHNTAHRTRPRTPLSPLPPSLSLSSSFSRANSERTTHPHNSSSLQPTRSRVEHIHVLIAIVHIELIVRSARGDGHAILCLSLPRAVDPRTLTALQAAQALTKERGREAYVRSRLTIS